MSMVGIIYGIKINMSDVAVLMPYSPVLPRLAAADWLLLFSVKKKQNRGIAELINTNKNNRKPLIKRRLKIYSFVIYNFQLHS